MSNYKITFKKLTGINNNIPEKFEYDWHAKDLSKLLIDILDPYYFDLKNVTEIHIIQEFGIKD